MTDSDARTIVNHGPMSVQQWLAVAILVGLNALDGFDVMSISFAAPGIGKDWQLDPATLGWLLSMELVGMAVGSLLLGGIADRFGRRPTMLGCLIAMALGMSLAGQAANLDQLLMARLLTGLGIGGMLTALNAAIAEVSNDRWRSLATSMMVIGYAIGGVLGGIAVQQLLGGGGDWRDVFSFGALATAAFIPLVWFMIPETPAFLDRRRSGNALYEVNATLRAFGLPEATRLSSVDDEGRKSSIFDIFKPERRLTTLLITLAYFAHITSFYFILKWVPKIVVDMGFEAKAAAGVLTWLNVGGVIGGIIFGFVAVRMGLKRLSILVLLGSFALVAWFGQGASGLSGLSWMVLVVGLFTNSAVVGMYALIGRAFPTELRSTGTGFVIGVGRGGAALAPVLGGYLFQAGLGLHWVAAIMGLGSLIAAMALLAIPGQDTEL